MVTVAWDGGRCGPVQDRLRTVVADKIASAQQQIVELMIDRSFIAELTSPNSPNSPTSSAIVGAVVQMAAQLGLEVVAEGVETEAQRMILLALGCPLAQGYLFSRPISAAAFGQVLRDDSVGNDFAIHHGVLEAVV